MRFQESINILKQATKETLATSPRRIAFVLLVVVTFGLFVWIPVKLIPGNDLPFQLSIMTRLDFAMFGILSVLNALLILMQWHLFQLRRLRARSGVGMVITGGVGGLSATFASVLSTASCGACVTGFLGFLGTGGVLFVLDNRWQISLVSILIVVIALAIASNTIASGCKVCNVEASSQACKK